ncbi:MAG: EAL domain-containing protein [bacterium]|nr:EAL domain-containing protein [bacterium]
MSKSNIGLWTIELDNDCAPRMYADDQMRKLLGITQEITPEETYHMWYDNIHPDYYDVVGEGVEKIIAGNHAEIRYPWNHPALGLIYVRCGGVRDEEYKKGVRISGSHQDVTALIQDQRDELTGLYTKESFFRCVEEILQENPMTEYRILVSDIENFKMINEKYGIEKGDELLKYLAAAGKRIIPNYILGGRIYADKFVCLQYGVSQTPEEGRKIAQEILANAPVPNLIWKHGIYYTKFDRNLSVQAMVDRARLAVESIKGVYGVSCAVYDEKMSRKLTSQQQILENMEKAIENEEFLIYLQPKHNLHINRTGGAEALVRWIHPDLGFMSPGEFIPLFEKNGFVSKVDEYVVHKVCKLLKKWMEEGRECVPISVNLSRRDFEKQDFAKRFMTLIDSYEIPHNLIHVELTESALSDNPEQLSEIIEEMHDNGFTIELDDFGTGYSSLITLSNMALDILKLDMSIIRNDKPGSDRNVLDFCSQLVKMMKLQTVAEGVETKEQLERLRRLGCDYIQGYYYAKPLPVEEFEEYLFGK